MSKKQRHERRKIENARRQRARNRQAAVRTGATALAAAAAIGAGTSVYAVPIRFDNPAHGEAGHFHWETIQGDPLRWLDFTQDAASQPTTIGNSASGGPTELAHIGNAGGVGSVISNTSLNPVTLQSTGYFLEGVSSETMIPSGFTWNNQRYSQYAGYGPETLLPEGTPTYLGLRFNGPNYQYGWIGVVRTSQQLEAFAWGYETEPGVPIAAGAPEPGSLALLAFGAAGVAGCRRRRNRA